ncbi:hypothetical protein [Solibacillus sp. CAU 1738]|uniref:hypothetical protein n=1 Tax=Solibacillus sp. CAU 1738 TaxID=3140363 RepID=UPI00326009DE
MKLNELEYKGLNIFDEISTVEVAFDARQNTIHVFDTKMTVEPEYNFVAKQYDCSEGFLKMAGVLKDKRYLAAASNETVDEWMCRITWQFYCSNCKIITLKAGVFTKYDVKEFREFTNEQLVARDFYPKYVERLL